MVAHPMRLTQHTTRQRPLDFVRLASGVSGNGTPPGVSTDVRIRRWEWKYIGVSAIRVEILQGIHHGHASIGASPIQGETGATLMATITYQKWLLGVFTAKSEVSARGNHTRRAKRKCGR